jgi:hypothetical protein
MSINTGGPSITNDEQNGRGQRQPRVDTIHGLTPFTLLRSPIT